MTNILELFWSRVEKLCGKGEKQTTFILDTHNDNDDDILENMTDKEIVYEFNSFI